MFMYHVSMYLCIMYLSMFSFSKIFLRPIFRQKFQEILTPLGRCPGPARGLTAPRRPPAELNGFQPLNGSLT